MAMAMSCVGPGSACIVRRPVRCSARKESVVLGIETSCDDTGAAVVSSGGRILGESLVSQADMLRQYGGVMPLAAQKNHERAIDKVVEQALSDAKVRESDLSAVAVTIGPGLSLCLNVGVRKARSIARTWQLPFIGVHHMEAHALVVRLMEDDVEFPFLVLLVSGGHNLLLVAKQVGEYVQLGTTLDDAIGEAYDKTARLLGLELQRGGGPALEELALEGNPHSFKFSVPMRAHKDCNFSYAGLKTQVKLAIQSNKIEGPLSSATPSDRQTRANIAASFQRVAVVHLEDRCHRAVQWAKEMEPSLHQMVLSGGVASNKYLRDKLYEVAYKHNMKLFIPPPRLCTDNGVMVAWTGMEYLQLGLNYPPPQPDEPEESWVELKPRWPLGEVAEGRVEKSRFANSSPSLTSQVQRRKAAEEVSPMHSAAASISIQSLPKCYSSRKQTLTKTAMASTQVEVQKPLVAEEKAALLVPKALTWASLNGLVMGDKASERSVNPGLGIVHAPISLLPTPFSKPLFQEALELAPLFNFLVDRVSADAKFLQEALSRTRKVDHFTDRLLDIHSKITEEGITQTIQLGMHRSDYMCDMATGNLLQIELNTISSSFAGLGPVVSRLHRYLLDNVDHLESSEVPENTAAADFGDILGLAWKEFANERAVVLFVVQPDERNMYDQAWLELKLFEKHGATVVRRTLTELHSQARLAPNRTLLLEGQEVAVVYYRSGYSPLDYPSDLEWDVRLLLERSTAIKCPSISYHLAGTKKIQQELAKPNVLERFMDDKSAVAKIRKCFAGLWSLEDEGSSNIINEAIQDPDLFVLKPQREGGGNNIYGSDVRSKLSELSREGSDGLAAYILMQRIFPPAHISYLVRGGIWSPEQTISELGIFGAYLRNGDKEIVNKSAGYLLRTKVSHSNEGGVATGFAVLDSVYLV